MYYWQILHGAIISQGIKLLAQLPMWDMHALNVSYHHTCLVAFNNRVCNTNIQRSFQNDMCFTSEEARAFAELASYIEVSRYNWEVIILTRCCCHWWRQQFRKDQLLSFVILAPGHQGSHLKCMLFSGGYLFCEFPVCVLLRLSARVFVSGTGFWTGWTCPLCEVGIKFNHCVILAHNENIWLYLSIYQIINILGYVFCNFLSWVLIFFDFVLVCRYPRDMNFGIKSFFEWLLSFSVRLFFHGYGFKWNFTAVLGQFDFTSVGRSYMLDLPWNTVTTSYGCFSGSAVLVYLCR